MVLAGPSSVWQDGKIVRIRRAWRKMGKQSSLLLSSPKLPYRSRGGRGKRQMIVSRSASYNKNAVFRPWSSWRP